MGSLDGNPNPLGSIEELEKRGLDPARYPSCSKPEGFGRNMGCPHFATCIFAFKGSRPQNVAVARVYRVNNSAKVRIKPCFNYMAHEHPRRSSDPDTAYGIAIVGYEGDMVKIENTEKLHADKNPNCDGCRQGTCVARVTVTKETKVDRWLAPHEDVQQAAYAADVIEQMRKMVEREAMAESTGAKLPPAGRAVETTGGEAKRDTKQPA